MTAKEEVLSRGPARLRGLRGPPTGRDPGAIMDSEQPVTKLSLFWRVVITNAVVFAVGIAALGLTVPTVDFPLALTEALILLTGIGLIIVANTVLLRLNFRSLEELIGLMRRIDLLRPGQRLPVTGAGEVAELIRTFNDMLDRLEEERRLSSGRALLAQEAERQRIAQELHDEIGQSLTAVLLQLKRLSAAASDDVQPALQEVQEDARGSLDEVRRIARRLRPGVLEDLGLVRALNSLGTTFAEQTGVRVERRFDKDLPPLSQDLELVLYRVAQEGLTNVARHAGASRVSLSLARRRGGVTLRLADDGIGLNGTVEGNGLRGMRERALLVGGHLTVGSPPGGGVEIVLDAPVADGDGD